MFDALKLIGPAGLLVLTGGILVKKRETRNILFIIGGVFLEIYSILIEDWTFIILQIIVTLAAIYDLVSLKLKKSSKT